MLPYNQDNIAAIATPPGKSALAIVRFSGKNLIDLYRGFTHKAPKNRYAAFSKIYHPKNGAVLDEAVVVYFKSPHSFTGEDMIEISCHGGEAVKGSIVGAAVDYGIRIAEPGEFSLRSFLNGKMDLIQAEAVAALISSKGQLPSNICLEQIGGKVSGSVTSLRTDVLNILAVIENELNFSEEEIVPATTSQIAEDILLIKNSIDDLLGSCVAGKNIFSGIRIIIYGKPNSGKSTLFNAILGYNRMITSSTPGTTRDSVESWFELGGAPICLIDTAGIWDAKSSLDNLAVDKTKEELLRADICLLIDEENPFKLLNNDFKKVFQGPTVMVQSKADLQPITCKNISGSISVSAINNSGIDRLLTFLSTQVVDNFLFDRDSGALVTDRQRCLLEVSTDHLGAAIEQLGGGIGMDVVASTLRGFVLSVSEVVGDVADKDILDNIFNKFCVGK